MAGKKICTWRVFSNRNPNKEWNVKSRDSMSPPPRQLLSNWPFLTLKSDFWVYNFKSSLKRRIYVVRSSYFTEGFFKNNTVNPLYSRSKSLPRIILKTWIYSDVNPLIISQIYTIRVKTKDQDLVIPTVFFLLRDRIPGDGPKIFHEDFEVRVSSATKDIFPGTKISYCHFHWLQAI